VTAVRGAGYVSARIPGWFLVWNVFVVSGFLATAASNLRGNQGTDVPRSPWASRARECPDIGARLQWLSSESQQGIHKSANRTEQATRPPRQSQAARSDLSVACCAVARSPHVAIHRRNLPLPVVCSLVCRSRPRHHIRVSYRELRRGFGYWRVSAAQRKSLTAWLQPPTYRPPDAHYDPDEGW